MSMTGRIESVTPHHAGAARRLAHDPKRSVWRLQYGPCWCQGTPGETGSFDFVRTSTRRAGLGRLESNILILSDRVIDGSQPLFLQVYEQVPAPKLVVATAACRAATAFWKELPVGWTPVHDLLRVDLHVDECVSGHPEALIAAVLDYVLTRPDSTEADQGEPHDSTGLPERDVVAH